MSVFGRNILEARNLAAINGYLCRSPLDVADANYQHKIDKLLDEVYEYENQIKEDNEAMYSLFESKYNLTNSFLSFGDLKNELEQQIVNMKSLLEGEFDQQMEELFTMPEFSDISGNIAALSNVVDSDELEDQLIDAMTQPIVNSVGKLAEFLPDLGLPGIPIIPDLGKILRTFATIGRLIYNLPEEYIKPAETSFAQKASEVKSRIMGRLGELAQEIGELIKTAIQQIPNILTCVILVSVLKILDIFKPIIDMFKLDITLVLNILTVAKTAAEAFASGGVSLINRIKKYLQKKVNKFIYVLQYLYSNCEGNLPYDQLILECQRDILSCTAEISGLNLEKDLADSIYQIERTKISQDKITKELQRLSGQKDKIFSIRNGYMSTAGITAAELDGMQERLSALEEQMKLLTENKDARQKAVDACTSEAKQKFVDSEILNFNLDATGEKFLVAMEAQRQLEQEARIQMAQDAIIKGVDMTSDLTNRFANQKLNQTGVTGKLQRIGLV